MVQDLTRIIRETMDNNGFPWQLSVEEGYGGLDGPTGLKAVMAAENLEIRHTPNYPGQFPGFDGGKWYIWPLTTEAAAKWQLSDRIEDYLPAGLAVQEEGGLRLPSGELMLQSMDNGVIHWKDGKYAADLGGCAAIGEIAECYIHDGCGCLSFRRGVIPERYVPIAEYRAKVRAITMSDGEYELAIGEGIPADSPLLQTARAKKARVKLAGGEVV